MLKAIIGHALSCMMLRYSNVVILPSMYALNNYKKSDIKIASLFLYFLTMSYQIESTKARNNIFLYRACNKRVWP